MTTLCSRCGGHGRLLDHGPCWECRSIIGNYELEALRDVEGAARMRLAKGHNDTCGNALGPGYACSCGHDGLGEALERLDAARGG